MTDALEYSTVGTDWGEKEKENEAGTRGEDFSLILHPLQLCPGTLTRGKAINITGN